MTPEQRNLLEGMVANDNLRGWPARLALRALLDRERELTECYDRANGALHEIAKMLSGVLPGESAAEAVPRELAKIRALWSQHAAVREEIAHVKALCSHNEVHLHSLVSNHVICGKCGAVALAGPCG